MLSVNFLLAVLCSWASITSIPTAEARVAKHHGYHLVEEYKPHNWFDKFDFFRWPDPTNGFVQYVSRKEANETGLIRVHNNHSHPIHSHVYMGVDHTNTYNAVGPGRKSVRIQTKKSYTQGLFILNLKHMPHGCGTWPAWWTFGPKWPTHGEIDIIEGVNQNKYNLMTLHTDADCTIAGAEQRGTLVTNNCDSVRENVGCSVLRNKTATYGKGFNRQGGGVYAMEWTSSHIKIWHWEHHNVPKSISEGKPDPEKFGLPTANLAGSCNIAKHFRDHTITFDMTFCGDFAGGSYSQSTCPLSRLGHLGCNEFVAKNPTAFENAYWMIKSMHVFQKPGGEIGKFHEPKYTSVVPVVSTAPHSASILPPPMGHTSTTTYTTSKKTSTKKHLTTSTSSTSHRHTSTSSSRKHLTTITTTTKNHLTTITTVRPKHSTSITSKSSKHSTSITSKSSKRSTSITSKSSKRSTSITSKSSKRSTSITSKSSKRSTSSSTTSVITTYPYTDTTTSLLSHSTEYTTSSSVAPTSTSHAKGAGQEKHKLKAHHHGKLTHKEFEHMVEHDEAKEALRIDVIDP